MIGVTVADISPQNDIAKMVSETLKRVDHLIKAGNIDQSIREIIQAKQLDPKNIYIYAYEERLAYLKQEHEKNIERERTRRDAEEAARKRNEELLKCHKEEHVDQEKTPKAELDQQEIREQSLNIQKTEEVPTLPSHANVNPSVLEAYARLLRNAWNTGTPSEDKRKTLTVFCNKNSIPVENLDKLEQEIKYTAYSEALRKVWFSGNATPPQDVTLQQLRNTFALSEDESHHIEEQILTELQNEKKAPTILIIDDDEKLLELISDTLTSAGYEIISLTTSDEAYTLLQKKWIPKLIICDINLETSTMSGFSFYEKIREIKQLDDVPFIFLTGLKDELLAWKGRELGADDYLTKPISEKHLLAAIKGKLKRFSILKKKS